MAIYKAILKYGYFNFKLEILEYCTIDNLLEREQYYIDIIKPEYNILKVAGSSLHYKHTKETLLNFNNRKFSAKTKAKLAKSATGRVTSEETKKKLSLSHTGKKISLYKKKKLSAITTNRVGISIIVRKISNNSLNNYPSITEGAKALGVSRATIRKAIKLSRVIKKDYLINYLNLKV